MPRCHSQSRNLSLRSQSSTGWDSLKEIEKGRLTQPSDGDPAADTTFQVTPKQKQKAPAPIDTPHNTAAVQSHVVAVLDELDFLAVQGIPSDHRG